jgi:hypothetical protein
MKTVRKSIETKYQIEQEYTLRRFSVDIQRTQKKTTGDTPHLAHPVDFVHSSEGDFSIGQLEPFAED